jgi:hypothetical protein
LTLAAGRSSASFGKLPKKLIVIFSRDSAACLLSKTEYLSSNFHGFGANPLISYHPGAVFQTDNPRWKLDLVGQIDRHCTASWAAL